MYIQNMALLLSKIKMALLYNKIWLYYVYGSKSI
jgi:hypothetical protein